MTKEVQVIPTTEITAGASPMELAQSFLANGGDFEVLEKMLAFQEKYDAIQAKKSFVKAMANFKTQPIVIPKDKTNSQYGSKYSSLGATVNSCLPRMGECGLSHKWDFVQTDKKMTGTCIVTHKDGHSDEVSMDSPIDTSGSKNPIQQLKSTRTYIKIETFASLMGLASSEDVDDDGNAAGKQTKCLSENQCIEIREAVESIDGLTEAEFLKMAGCESVEEIHAVNFKKAKIALNARAKAAK